MMVVGVVSGCGNAMFTEGNIYSTRFCCNRSVYLRVVSIRGNNYMVSDDVFFCTKADCTALYTYTNNVVFA